MFTVAELAAAAQLGLALPVLVVDNGGYGEIRNEMVERGDPVAAVDLGSVDFAALGPLDGLSRGTDRRPRRPDRRGHRGVRGRPTDRALAAGVLVAPYPVSEMRHVQPVQPPGQFEFDGVGTQ